MQPLISIVIPIYNVERYVSTCVQSVLKQTYKNLEVLLIDDGSTDSSATLCDQMKEQDSRIQVIHKTNEGLGLARNTGLQLAKGEYIAFVDSDDYIANDMIETLYERICLYQSDVCFCNYYRVESGKVPFSTEDNPKQAHLYSKEEVKGLLLNMICAPMKENLDIVFMPSVCMGLYSMSLISSYDMGFHSERELISEDLIFNLEFLSKARTVCYIPKCLYYYRYNPSSLSKSYKKNRFELEKKQYNYLAMAGHLPIEEEEYQQRIKRMFLGRVRACVKQEVGRRGERSRKEIYSSIKKICSDSLVQWTVRTYPYHLNSLRQAVFFILMEHRCIILLQVMMILFIKFKKLK